MNRNSRTKIHSNKPPAKIAVTAKRAILFTLLDSSSSFSVLRWGALFPVDCFCEALVWADDTFPPEVEDFISWPCVFSAGVDCVGDLVPVRIKKGIILLGERTINNVHKKSCTSSFPLFPPASVFPFRWLPRRLLGPRKELMRQLETSRSPWPVRSIMEYLLVHVCKGDW